MRFETIQGSMFSQDVSGLNVWYKRGNMNIHPERRLCTNRHEGYIVFTIADLAAEEVQELLRAFLVTFLAPLNGQVVHLVDRDD